MRFSMLRLIIMVSVIAMVGGYIRLMVYLALLINPHTRGQDLVAIVGLLGVFIPLGFVCSVVLVVLISMGFWQFTGAIEREIRRRVPKKPG